MRQVIILTHAIYGYRDTTIITTHTVKTNSRFSAVQIPAVVFSMLMCYVQCRQLDNAVCNNYVHNIIARAEPILIFFQFFFQQFFFSYLYFAHYLAIFLLIKGFSW